MANFWAKRINYDISRIGEVPRLWREKVRAIIEQRDRPLESMTKAELIEHAEERGVTVTSGMTKADIIEAIREA